MSIIRMIAIQSCGVTVTGQDHCTAHALCGSLSPITRSAAAEWLRRVNAMTCDKFENPPRCVHMHAH